MGVHYYIFHTAFWGKHFVILFSFIYWQMWRDTSTQVHYKHAHEFSCDFIAWLVFLQHVLRKMVSIDQSHQWIGLASYEWRRLLVYEGFRCAYAPVASPARIARPTLGFCNKSILWPPLLPGITSGTQKEDSLSNMFPLVESFRRLISRSLVIRVSIFKI